MGTRHAIIVKGNGKILVQQYGQWDGYFGYQGKKVVEFVKDNLTYSKSSEYVIEHFEKHTKELTDYETDKLIEDLREVYKKNGMENLAIKTLCPSLSRDTGADILEMIYRGYSILPLHFTSLSEINNWCEYVYIVDLDNREVACLTNHKVNNAITYACPQVTERVCMNCFVKLPFAEIKKKSIKTIVKQVKEVNPDLI
jgi:hypothetical protein